MKQIKFTSALFILLVFIGGGKVFSDSHSHNESHSEHSTEHNKTRINLRLDNGIKWEMDEHTKSSLKKMESLVGSNNNKLKGKDLEKELDSLIQGCTMTGSAHDELHKFLSAYIPAVHKFSTDENEDNLNMVKELLTVYPEFFQ